MAETIPAKTPIQPERRRGMRFPFSAEAEVTLEGTAQKVPARVTEIGPQGCYLQMGKPFDTGSPIFVKFFAEATFFETKGERRVLAAEFGDGRLVSRDEAVFRGRAAEVVAGSDDFEEQAARLRSDPSRAPMAALRYPNAKKDFLGDVCRARVDRRHGSCLCGGRLLLRFRLVW